MLSTFSGLETSRRALTTNQAALKTVGHNISNANTEGYSRQRVNMTTTESFPKAAFNKPGIPGQMGTGVEAGSVERVREQFLDVQFRQENQQHGYWNARKDGLEKMEDIINEPTDDGIAQTMDRFWESLQDLASNPEDAGTRSVVRQRGIAVAETINSTYNSLESIQRDYQNELGVKEDDINSTLRQIHNLNEQIASVEPHGNLPNDLYDQRDQLVDELSEKMNIQVERVSNGGLSKDKAEGSYHITAVDSNGNPIEMDNGEPMTLIDGENLDYRQIGVNFDSFDDDAVSDQLLDPVTGLSVFDSNGGEAGEVGINDFTAEGSLLGTIEIFGHQHPDSDSLEGAEDVTGDFPEMMKNLDRMVSTFAREFNEVHEKSFSLSEIENGEADSISFFQTNLDGSFGDLEDNESIVGVAKNFGIDDRIHDSLDNVAASAGPEWDDENDEWVAQDVDEAFAGDGSGAQALAEVKDAELVYDANDTNVQSFYQSVIGSVAVDTNEAQRLERNTSSLRDAVEERRQSVSSVSLDEEMSMMIQFQHAYNAAARNLTSVDEMLDRIINGMGRVGI
ncbi:flagellar hook-associated protein FlgK [Alkalicoccus chagannorensis]|uniref:flagellar hook-associated protein FlgK n=1 Tax=Alkalicoccus chagannorensis TaxID=427072 RepID=UPI00041DED49|nr:flagellar hook-associated protein FlgK [Alkalicoccus chagannorensis]